MQMTMFKLGFQNAAIKAFKALPCAFFLTVITALSSPAFADQEAEIFMSRVLVKANSAMAAQSEQERFTGVSELVDEYVDMRRTGRFVLGQYARKMTRQQAEIYYPLFERFATSIYQEVLSNYSGQELVVSGSVDRSERDIIVFSRLANAKRGDPLADTNFQWRLYRTPDGLKVVDAGADNIWLAIEQRSQFTAVVANNGGGTQGVDALIAQLQARLGE